MNRYLSSFLFLNFCATFFFEACTENNTNVSFQLKNSNQLQLKDSNQMKIGFGSCINQHKSLPIFESIKKDSFDLFFMLGDNVYGDSETKELEKLKFAYNKQKLNFKMLKFNLPFEAIWDDHDYGMNDGGKEYLFKESSKELFLKFWDIPSDDVRRSRKGLYFEKTYNIDNKILQVLFLDTRTFRDALLPSDNLGSPRKERYIPNQDSSLSILGKNQWIWLRKKINKTVDLRIIASSIQFLPIGHGWESWNNFPWERRKLIDLIDNTNLSHTLVISGDRHRGGLYQFRTDNGKIISEMTSSSLNYSLYDFENKDIQNKEEYGPLRIGDTFLKENYGSILVNSIDNSMSISLKNINGKIVKSIFLKN